MAHDLLNLPHLRVKSVTDNGNHYVIEAEGGVVPTACPECHHVGLHRFGTLRQGYMDAPIHGKRVKIEIERQRYRCKACRKTLLERMPHMDGKRLATERLIQYVEERCLKETFAALAREVGLDDKTIRHIFDDYVERLQQRIKFQTPEVLGIDELKIIGETRAMITDIRTLALFDMLPSRKKSELLPYFHNLPDKQRVKVVVMDMWSVYRQVADAELPGRPIVADRFHVTRTAQVALDRTRLAIRKGLDTRTRLQLKNERAVLFKRARDLTPTEETKLQHWTRLFPALGTAYALREEFAALYEHPTRAKAEAAGKKWQARAQQANLPHFRETLIALDSWWTEIFNWYDFRVTNAYTESINGIAKTVNRMGRGYSFEVIRARLLFDKRARVATTVGVVRKRVPKTNLAELFSHGGLPTWSDYAPIEVATEGDEIVEFGPHIPTLVRLLEEGYFS